MLRVLSGMWAWPIVSHSNPTLLKLVWRMWISAVWYNPNSLAPALFSRPSTSRTTLPLTRFPLLPSSTGSLLMPLWLESHGLWSLLFWCISTAVRQMINDYILWRVLINYPCESAGFDRLSLWKCWVWSIFLVEVLGFFSPPQLCSGDQRQRHHIWSKRKPNVVKFRCRPSFLVTCWLIGATDAPGLFEVQQGPEGDSGEFLCSHCWGAWIVGSGLNSRYLVFD